MNETLIASVSGGGYSFPTNTGPGPDTLVGYTLTNNDTQIAGFYGEVPSTELITGDALASLIGLSAGTSQNSDAPWLKFVLDGKILFTPILNFRYGLSWKNLNDVGVVYGQKVIKIKDDEFKVMLIYGANPEGTSEKIDGNDLNYTVRSDWNRLFYPITLADRKHTKGGEYKMYTNTALGITGLRNSASWCRDLALNDPNYCLYRGFSTIKRSGWATITHNHQNNGWRPFLELISE